MRRQFKVFGVTIGSVWLIGCIPFILFILENDCDRKASGEEFIFCRDGQAVVGRYVGWYDSPDIVGTRDDLQCNDDGTTTPKSQKAYKPFTLGPLFPQLLDPINPFSERQSSPSAEVAAYPSTLPVPFTPLAPRGFKPARGCNTELVCVRLRYGLAAAEMYGLCGGTRTVVPVGGNARQLDVAQDLGLAVAAGRSGLITFLNLATKQVSGTLQAPSGTTPSGVAITEDSSRAYITSNNSTSPGILILDLARRTFGERIATAANPESIFLTPDNSQLYVTFPQENRIRVYDVLNLELVAEIPVNSPVGIAFDPGGTRAYVSASGGASSPGAIVSIDAARYAVLKSYVAGIRPQDVIVSANGRVVFVNNIGSSFITVLDTTRDQTKTIDIGGKAIGLTLID